MTTGLSVSPSGSVLRSGAATEQMEKGGLKSPKSKSSVHWILSGLTRLVASNPPEIVRFEDLEHAPANNADMRSPDQYWFKQGCKAACGFASSEIVVHGQPPQPHETVIEYSNHRSYADGAIAVLAQNPPPLQIAVRHDPAEAKSFLGKVVEAGVNPVLDYAGCLTVSKPARGSDPKAEKKGDGAVAKIVEHLSKPESRFWAAAEGIICDEKDAGRVSEERIRTGVTVAGLQAQVADVPAAQAKPYAMAIGNGANASIQYGIARFGQMAGMATACSMALGTALGMYFSQSETTKTALPLLGMALYGLANRAINKTVDKLVPNKEQVLANKPKIHVQWRRFDLPKNTVPIEQQRPGNPEWDAVIKSGKKKIAEEINLAQAQLNEYGQ